MCLLKVCIHPCCLDPDLTLSKLFQVMGLLNHSKLLGDWKSTCPYTQSPSSPQPFIFRSFITLPDSDPWQILVVYFRKQDVIVFISLACAVPVAIESQGFFFSTMGLLRSS